MTVIAEDTPVQQLPSVSLFMTEGSSDKEYHAQVQAQDGGFVVNFQYGRRGSALKAGCKTSTPVPLERATLVFSALVKEKMAKGYTPSETGVAFQQSSKEALVSGVLPQLLNAITRQEAERLIEDDAWFGQQKFDGERRLLRRAGQAVSGISRLGLEVALPLPVAEQACAAASDSFVIDGEMVGARLIAFDLLEIGGRDLRELPLESRLEQLESLCAAFEGGEAGISMAVTARTSAQKRRLFDNLESLTQEGMVFKRADAHYSVGRPASGGDALKFKFQESATLEVSGVNAGKRSVEVQARDEAGVVHPLGNVTIPPNFDVPAVGAIVEVRYLYAYKNGSLFQPVFLGPRFDQELAACNLAQLKYKADHQDVELHSAALRSAP